MSQVKTRMVKIDKILRSHEFTRGFKDFREGQPYPILTSWSYERGRLFAALVGKDFHLKDGKRITYKALLKFDEAIASKDII